jgi:hypothetical protein
MLAIFRLCGDEKHYFMTTTAFSRGNQFNNRRQEIALELTSVLFCIEGGSGQHTKFNFEFVIDPVFYWCTLCQEALSECTNHLLVLEMMVPKTHTPERKRNAQKICRSGPGGIQRREEGDPAATKLHKVRGVHIAQTLEMFDFHVSFPHFGRHEFHDNKK